MRFAKRRQKMFYGGSVFCLDTLALMYVKAIGTEQYDRLISALLIAAGKINKHLTEHK